MFWDTVYIGHNKSMLMTGVTFYHDYMVITDRSAQ